MKVSDYFKSLRRRMSPQKVLTRLVGSDPTQGYRSPRTIAHELATEKLPMFTTWRARMMMRDPVVVMGLNIRNAILSAAEIEVRCNDPRVGDYLMGEWNMAWRKLGAKVRRAKNYGYQAVQWDYCRKETGLVGICGAKDFSPHDVRGLTHNNRIVGFSVRGGDMERTSRRRVFAPMGTWFTYDDEFGQHYGHAILRKSYSPWFEKWMRGGAIPTRRLRMIKDAYIGDRIYFPYGEIVTDHTGAEVPWKEVFREMSEWRLNGSTLMLPMLRDANGNKKVEYEGPEDTGNPDAIFKWVERTDIDIWRGMSIFEEVVHASETGSGYSGRSVPMALCIQSCQEELIESLRQFDEQTLRQMVYWNFGRDIDYEIEAKMLLETFSDAMGESSMGGSAMGGNNQQQQLPPAQQPGGQQQIPEKQPKKEKPPQQFAEGGDIGTPISYEHADAVAALATRQIRRDGKRASKRLNRRLFRIAFTAAAAQSIIDAITETVDEVQPAWTETTEDAFAASSLLGVAEVQSRYDVAVAPVEGQVTPSFLVSQGPPVTVPPPPTAEIFSREPKVVFPVEVDARRELAEATVFTAKNWRETAEAVQQGAFAVTSDMSDRVTDELREAVSEALKRGTTREEFIKQAEDIMSGETGALSEARIELVYRANTASYLSNAAERSIKNPLVSDAFPYVRYQATNDDRVRPEHIALETSGIEGTAIYAGDDPVWQTFRPPWCYSCRCNWAPVTARQAERGGVMAARHVPWPKVDGEPIEPCEGWERTPQFAERQRDIFGGWVEEEHPRQPKGTKKGGEFAPKETQGKLWTGLDLLPGQRDFLDEQGDTDVSRRRDRHTKETMRQSRKRNEEIIAGLDIDAMAPMAASSPLEPEDADFDITESTEGKSDAVQQQDDKTKPDTRSREQKGEAIDDGPQFARQKIVDALAGGETLTLRELADKIGIRAGEERDPLTSPLNRALVALRDDGTIKVHESKSGFGQPRFSLEEEEEEKQFKSASEVAMEGGSYADWELPISRAFVNEEIDEEHPAWQSVQYDPDRFTANDFNAAKKLFKVKQVRFPATGHLATVTGIADDMRLEIGRVWSMPSGLLVDASGNTGTVPAAAIESLEDYVRYREKRGKNVDKEKSYLEQQSLTGRDKIQNTVTAGGKILDSQGRERGGDWLWDEIKDWSDEEIEDALAWTREPNQASPAQQRWAGGPLIGEQKRRRKEKPASLTDPAKLAAKKADAGEQFAEDDDNGGAGWKTVGGAPAYVEEDGEITKGCAGLKGYDIDELDETREEREDKQERADAGEDVESEMKTEDVFESITQDLWKMQVARANEYNSTLSELVSQFQGRGQRMGGFFRRVKKAEDPTAIPGFDEMVQAVRNDNRFGVLLRGGGGESTGSGDIEHQLFTSLKRGRMLKPTKDDEDLLAEAAEIMKSIETRSKSDPELADVPFSEVYRSLKDDFLPFADTQHMLSFVEEEHPRAPKGTSKGGEFVPKTGAKIEEKRPSEVDNPLPHATMAGSGKGTATTRKGEKMTITAKTKTGTEVDIHVDRKDLEFTADIQGKAVSGKMLRWSDQQGGHVKTTASFRGKPVGLSIPKESWNRAVATHAEAIGQKSLAAKDDIKQGREKIKASYHDGEYLSGYMVHGEAADMLVDLGIAKNVSGWGTIVDEQAVKELGKEFTYQQASDFAAPAIEKQKDKALAQERKAADIRKAAMDKAKETGTPQVFRSWTEPCDSSTEECSTDAVSLMIDAEGRETTRRTHTY